MQRRWERHGPQAKNRMNGEFQRQSEQARRFARRFDQINEPQRFPIGAEQDMQTVVKSRAVDFYAPRPAAQNAARFEYRDLNAVARKVHRCGHAGITAADYGDARTRAAL